MTDTGRYDRARVTTRTRRLGLAWRNLGNYSYGDMDIVEPDTPDYVGTIRQIEKEMERDRYYRSLDRSYRILKRYFLGNRMIVGVLTRLGVESPLDALNPETLSGDGVEVLLADGPGEDEQ